MARTETATRSRRQPKDPAPDGLARNRANFAPLTPVGFLARAAAIAPRHVAIVHGTLRRSWAETHRRCRQLAAALRRAGLRRGDTVALVAPNIPAAYECAFGVPMAGGVLNAMNIRLDAATIAFMLDHGRARVLLTDTEFAPVVAEALRRVRRKPLVIDIADPLGPADGTCLGTIDYEAFLRSGDPDSPLPELRDEWEAIALNYTSGTTGDPKGVVYHHRGAYLNALGNVLVWTMPARPVYLWTLPMFHCNGWCFPWTIAAMLGTNICLRRVEAAAVFDVIARENVTHFCAAPVILNMLVNAASPPPRASGRGPVEVMTAASAPPAAVIEKMERLGFRITHVYGLTEVYGPAVTCEWDPAWNTRDPESRARLKARQGVRYPVLEGLMVADPRTLARVPSDGETIGEVFMRGHIVMKGYLRNPKATRAAFRGGWFHTGDLGVMHPDGYLELKDRSKDIIISGGENISTIEVENALYRHKDILEAAIVAKPDPTWGETPCAFVTLKPGAEISADEVIAFCRAQLAHFKCPRHVVFGPLPKTSTGKIQKFQLRARARPLG